MGSGESGLFEKHLNEFGLKSDGREAERGNYPDYTGAESFNNPGAMAANYGYSLTEPDDLHWASQIYRGYGPASKAKNSSAIDDPVSYGHAMALKTNSNYDSNNVKEMNYRNKFL